MTSIRVRVDQDRAIDTLTTREIAWINDLMHNKAVQIDERLDSPLATEPGPHQGATTRDMVV